MEEIGNRTPLNQRSRQGTIDLLLCDCPRNKFYPYLLGALALTILIVVIVVIVNAAQSPSPSSPDTIYRLERVWPKAMCWNASCVNNITNNWTITRLSTEMSDKKVLEKCGQLQDLPEIKDPLKIDLDELWPALLKDKVAQTVWNDAWKMDGNCTGWKVVDNAKPWEDYFQQTIKLANDNAIDSKLIQKQIVPHPLKRYSTKQVTEALGDKVVTLTCGEVEDLYYVTSIEQCFHTTTTKDANGNEVDTIQPIDCVDGKGNCDHPFLYLP